MDCKGICLRATSYKEADKLLTLATFEKGILTVKAKGVRSPKAKLAAGCMPLVFGEFSLAETRGGYILTGVSAEENFKNCWTDPARNLAALLVLEAVEKLCLKGESVSYELVLALKALQEINYGAAYPYAAGLWFLLELLRYTGVDYTEERLPPKIISVLGAFSGVSVEDTGALELLPSDIDDALYSLDCVIRGRLSTNLAIIKQIYTLNAGRRPESSV